MAGDAISPPAPARSGSSWAPNGWPQPRRSPRRSRATSRATVGIIAELNRQISELETTLANHFETHPDADIYLSQPGLGDVLGARVLGEFGDDPNRYTDAKSRRNYAGTSPLTVASGKKRAVLARHVRNRRLYDAIDHWALCALSASPGPGPTTTSIAPPATPTTKPCAPSATASSASCTAAYATTSPTTNTPPGHIAKTPEPLDNLRTWDVYTRCRRYRGWLRPKASGCKRIRGLLAWVNTHAGSTTFAD